MLNQIHEIETLPKTNAEWAVEQDKCDKLKEMKAKVKEHGSNKYTVDRRNLLQYISQGKRLIVVPSHLRKTAMQICHDTILAGHYGRKKTSQKLARNFVWKGIKQDCVDYVKTCPICQVTKTKNHKKYGLFIAKPESPQLNEISVDLIGKLPRSTQGNTFALIIHDNFSRWIKIYPIRCSTSKVVLNRLIDYMTDFGFPKSIRSDNGACFVNNLWKKILKYLGIKQKLIAPYRPQGNPCERSIKEIKKRLKRYCDNHKKWDEHLSIIAYTINSTVNSETGFTPNALFLGRELLNPLLPEEETEPISPTTHAYQLIQKLESAQIEAMEHIVKSKAKLAGRYNDKRQPHHFQIGHLVTKENNKLSSAIQGYAAGLAPERSENVLQILEKISENSFKLRSLQDGKTIILNADQIEIFHRRPLWARK
jgi:transposase InsO family protein